MIHKATAMVLLVTVAMVAGCTSAPVTSPVAPGTSAPGPGSPSPSTAPSSAASPTIEPVPSDPGPVGHWIECRNEETVCDIHVTADGSEVTGSPVTVDGPCPVLRTGVTGLGYVGCSTAEGVTVHVLDLQAREVAGWPMRLPGTLASVSWNDFSIVCGIGRSAVQVAVDGAVHVAISRGPQAWLHVVEADGTPRAGWPQAIPGDAPGPDGSGGDGCRGIAIGDDDTVFAWGYEDIEMGMELTARRTEFTSWSPDGAVRPGWPRGSVGAASGPVVDAEGGLTYVTAAGRVWRHDARGEIRPGWPYQLPRPTPPYIAPDGRIALVVGEPEGRDLLVLLDLAGRPVTGGPIELPAPVETRCVFGDVPCAGMTGPAFADDGTTYLSLGSPSDEDDAGGSIVAIDREGRIVDGWPVDLGPRTHLIDLAVDAVGRLVGRGVVCAQDYCGADEGVAITLIFAPDGRIVDRQPEG